MEFQLSKNEYGFRNLFSSYFWLGLVLVLFAVILDLQFSKMPFWALAITGLIESIGIAILVASIFTYASGTSEFVNKIKSLLQDIVVSRNFLGNIDSESKRDALSALIKPSSEEKRVYSNIEDYLNTYISQTMDITNKCVRSNYNVHARAYINKEHKVVCVDSSISYRLYPTKDGYSDIKVGFLASEILSTCNNVVVNTPHGEREVFDNIDFKDVNIDVGLARIATIDLSKHAKKCSHLDVTIELTESGSDHWIMLSFGAMMPTDGFKHTLRCSDGLKINSFHTFIHGAKFYTDRPSDMEITTSCNEWVNEGTGLSILISHPHQMPNKSLKQDK
jgi:hypothetical protein